ncbi:tetratricopeptide repeat protein [Planctomycetota bacterium]
MNGKRISIWCMMILAGLVGMSHGDDVSNIVLRGNQLYEDGLYDEALSQYDQAQLEESDDPVLLYNRANCYYKLEDYSGALDLYQKVSALSKDMQLVVRAKYNLGNCHFQRGMKQLDSDSQKALDELTASVRYYRQVRDIDPEDEDAAHNIAVARLVIKDLLDRIKKEQEKQQQQQQQNQMAQKIAELLQQQGQLLQKTMQTQDNMSDPNEPTPTELQQLTEQAQEQQTLQNDTRAVGEEAQQMLEQIIAQTNMDPNSAAQMQEPMEIMDTVVRELNQAVGQQGQATEHLNEGQAPPAAEDELGAAESLYRALRAFPESAQQQPQDQQQQEQNQPDQQQQDQQQYAAPDTTAQDILNQEKDRRNRRQQRVRGGINPVIKDW